MLPLLILLSPKLLNGVVSEHKRFTSGSNNTLFRNTAIIGLQAFENTRTEWLLNMMKKKEPLLLGLQAFENTRAEWLLKTTASIGLPDIEDTRTEWLLKCVLKKLFVLFISLIVYERFVQFNLGVMARKTMRISTTASIGLPDIEDTRTKSLLSDLATWINILSIVVGVVVNMMEKKGRGWIDGSYLGNLLKGT
ncbi:hypothetical protein BD770DRAFT_427831 [Pilaira anomala]|nr:hypothetical protein BD770DRAFT_427831 [Pilaira anomala]